MPGNRKKVKESVRMCVCVLSVIFNGYIGVVTYVFTIFSIHQMPGKILSSE